MTFLSMFHDPGRRALRWAGISAACVLLSGSRRDPEFMRYDVVNRSVELTITAALDKSNSGYNCNGGSYGAHRVTVPTGWKVTIAFVNRDVIPHSVAVIREVRLLPLRIARPVFAGAASRAPEVGIPAGARQDDIAFVANRPGAYLIACGVAGHAVSGSYIRLTVSSVDSLPTYETVHRASSAAVQH